MFKIYYRTNKKNNRPVNIKLEDYTPGGDIKSGSRGEALRRWYSGDVTSSNSVRKPSNWDMIKDPEGNFFVLTSSGIWSKISLG